MLTENIQSYLSDLNFILPEIIMAIGIIFLIVLDLIFYQKKATIKTTIGLFIILLSSVSLIYFPSVEESILFKTLNPNKSSIFFRLLADIVMFTVLLFWNFSKSKAEKSETTEYPFLWLSVLFAAHFLCISNNWLMVFLSIEMISISSYILLGIGFSKANIEAAFKYLVFGALSTGIMVFGISLIMAHSQNIFFSGFSFSYSSAFEQVDLLSIGLLMAFAGIYFKLSLFPFHFWAPDVYQGSSLPFMLMLSSLPKIAAFGFLTSQFLIIWPQGEFGASNFSNLLASLGIISIIWANLSALRQSSFSRLFAYSGIAQGGFMILALVNGYRGILNLEIFLSLYVFMNLIVFLIADIFNKKASDLKMIDFSGLGRVNIFISLTLTIALIALVGLPPTGGFTAKFIILSGVFEWYSSTDQNFRLVVFILAIINMVISLFYYLKIPFYMYFRTGDLTFKKTGILQSVLLIISVSILLLSFFLFSNFKELLILIGAEII